MKISGCNGVAIDEQAALIGAFMGMHIAAGLYLGNRHSSASRCQKPLHKLITSSAESYCQRPYKCGANRAICAACMHGRQLLLTQTGAGWPVSRSHSISEK